MVATLRNKKSVDSNETIRTNPPRNMSVVESAAYLGVSERKVRELIARRELRHVRLGKRIIIRKVDLDAFLETLVHG